jgi:hypothetical protein
MESPKAPKIIEVVWKGFGIKWITQANLGFVNASTKHGKSQPMKNVSQVMTPPTLKPQLGPAIVNTTKPMLQP